MCLSGVVLCGLYSHEKDRLQDCTRTRHSEDSNVKRLTDAVVVAASRNTLKRVEIDLDHLLEEKRNVLAASLTGHVQLTLDTVPQTPVKRNYVYHVNDKV